MPAEHRILQTLRKHIGEGISNTQPEQGTVISGTPLVIQLDYDPTIQLHFVDGDLVVNDQLILATGDRVVLEEMKGKGTVYFVHARIGGTVGESKTGDGSRAVARFGDLVTGTFTGGGPGGAVSGTISGQISTGSSKVKVQ